MLEHDPLSQWDSFAEAVRLRLKAGRAAYKDESFRRPPAVLVEEIKEELLDVCAWSFILWVRICRLRAAVTQAADLEQSS